MAIIDRINDMTEDPLFRNIMETSPFFPLLLFNSARPEYPGYISSDWYESEADVILPYTTYDNYSFYYEPIGEHIEMLSGRVVWEHRGMVKKIEYAYDYMPHDLWKRLSNVLRSGHPFSAYYLRDDSEYTLEFDTFVCESLTPPKFAYAVPELDFGEGDIRPAMGVWHGIQFTLRQYMPDTEYYPLWLR